MALPIYTSSAFTGQNGLEIASEASVEVRSETDDSLVTLYSDRAGTTQIDNPMTADEYGRFEFYAAPNSDGWRIKVTSGDDTHTLRYQQPMGSAGGVQATTFGMSLIDDEDAEAGRETLEALGEGDVAALLRGHISGLTLSNNASTSDTVIDVAAGVATADDQSAVIQASAGTIDFSTTGADALDTGTVAADTWYHCFVIRKSGDGTVARLASTSVDSPTMPTGYDQKRRIGSILTDDSADILAFVQHGDRFSWLEVPLDVNVSDLGATPASYTLSTPLGVKTTAIMNVQTSKSGSTPSVYAYEIDQNDPEALGTGGVIASVRSIVSNIGSPVGAVAIVTDTSSQIQAVASEAGVSFAVSTLGYIDHLGRFD